MKCNTYYKNILSILDLYNNNHISIKKIVKISSILKANIDIMYIINIPSPYVTHAFTVNIKELIYKEGKKKLKNFCKYYNISQNHQHILIGLSILNIIKFIKFKKIDLIIIENYNNCYLFSKLIDPIMIKLLHKINCDLLIISLK